MLRAGIIGLLAAFVSVVLVRLLFSVIPDPLGSANFDRIRMLWMGHGTFHGVG